MRSPLSLFFILISIINATSLNQNDQQNDVFIDFNDLSPSWTPPLPSTSSSQNDNNIVNNSMQRSKSSSYFQLGKRLPNNNNNDKGDLEQRPTLRRHSSSYTAKQRYKAELSLDMVKECLKKFKIVENQLKMKEGTKSEIEEENESLFLSSAIIVDDLDKILLKKEDTFRAEEKGKEEYIILNCVSFLTELNHKAKTPLSEQLYSSNYFDSRPSLEYLRISKKQEESSYSEEEGGKNKRNEIDPGLFLQSLIALRNDCKVLFNHYTQALSTIDGLASLTKQLLEFEKETDETSTNIRRSS